MAHMKRIVAFLLCLPLLACMPRAAQQFVQTRGEGSIVKLSKRVSYQLDSIARRSVETNSEQMACVERFTIVERRGRKIITLQRLGETPVPWISDSMSVRAIGFTHLCYYGHPSVHTHPVGFPANSAVDFNTAFEREQSPFAVLLVLLPHNKWQVSIYAVRP